MLLQDMKEMFLARTDIRPETAKIYKHYLGTLGQYDSFTEIDYPVLYESAGHNAGVMYRTLRAFCHWCHQNGLPVDQENTIPQPKNYQELKAYELWLHHEGQKNRGSGRWLAHDTKSP